MQPYVDPTRKTTSTKMEDNLKKKQKKIEDDLKKNENEDDLKKNEMKTTSIKKNEDDLTKQKNLKNRNEGDLIKN